MTISILKRYKLLAFFFFGFSSIGFSKKLSQEFNFQFEKKLTISDSDNVKISFERSELNLNYFNLSYLSNSRDLFGTINFYDSKGRIIYQLKEIEIPHAPGYHVIDVSKFPKGEITIEIFVDDVSNRKKINL